MTRQSIRLAAQGIQATNETDRLVGHSPRDAETHRAIFRHHQTVRTMAVLLARALPPSVDADWLIEAGERGLVGWCHGDGPNVLEDAVRGAMLTLLQTDERLPGHIRQGFAGVVTLNIPQPQRTPAI